VGNIYQAESLASLEKLGEVLDWSVSQQLPDGSAMPSGYSPDPTILALCEPLPSYALPIELLWVSQGRRPWDKYGQRKINKGSESIGNSINV
jgi:hypothetical protein